MNSEKRTLLLCFNGVTKALARLKKEKQEVYYALASRECNALIIKKATCNKERN